MSMNLGAMGFSPYGFGGYNDIFGLNTMGGFGGGLGGFGGGLGLGGGIFADPMLSMMPGMYGMQDPKKMGEWYNGLSEMNKQRLSLTEDINKQQLLSSDSMRRTNNDITLRRESEMYAIQDAANSLGVTIADNKANQVMPQFDRFVELLGQLPEYRNLSSQNPLQLRALAKQIFKQQYGVTVEDAVKQNCTSSFGTGVKAGMSLGSYAKPSKDDIIASLTNTKVDLLDRAQEVVGSAGGGAITGGTIGGVVGAVALGMKGGMKFGLWGALGGALVGLGTAVNKFANS